MTRPPASMLPNASSPYRPLPQPCARTATVRSAVLTNYEDPGIWYTKIDHHRPTRRRSEKNVSPTTTAYSEKTRTFSLSLLKAFSCSAGGSLLCQTAQHLLITSSTLLGLSCRHFRVVRIHRRSAGAISRPKTKNSNGDTVAAAARLMRGKSGGVPIILLRWKKHNNQPPNAISPTT